jgi:hypothetical protein
MLTMRPTNKMASSYHSKPLHGTLQLLLIHRLILGRMGHCYVCTLYFPDTFHGLTRVYLGR